MNNDLIVSWIRTGVAVVAGVVISWAVRHNLPIGDLDQAKATAWCTPLCIAGYYAAVRAAERQWPELGWLFGVAKAPLYVKGDAPAPDVDAPRMVAEPAKKAPARKRPAGKKAAAKKATPQH